ncbi:hypothetical protein [Helicobacter rodentium]|nr:hypothetical protein [Helicobacter rodentium]
MQNINPTYSYKSPSTLSLRGMSGANNEAVHNICFFIRFHLPFDFLNAKL